MKTKFKHVKEKTPFLLKGALGDADMIRIIPRDGLNAICIASKNGSYQKQKCYFIPEDQEVEVNNTLVL